MQKKSKLDAPKTKKKVAQMLVLGSSHADVTRELHVSESQMPKRRNP